MQLNKILYATDYSPPSMRALPYATLLARQAGAKLLIVHVTQLEFYPVGEIVDEEPTPPTQEIEQLKQVVPDNPQVQYEHHLLHAEPPHEADKILELARQDQADLIVIGTHGRSGVSRLLAGSVAESVLRNAPCPVLTVK